jgi:hypothetical protein
VTTVAIWKDKSGNGYDAVGSGDFPTLVENGINNMPAIYFETSSQQLQMPTINMENYTCFIVLKTEEPTTNRAYFVNDGLYVGFRDNGSEYAFSMEPAESHLPFKRDKFQPNVPQVYCISRTGYDGTMTFRINKENIDTNGTQIRRWARTSTNWIGYKETYISEILLYNRELTEEEKNQIEDYLITKYELVV